MNANDIMNALSGIDPEYIDEAAYELHGTEDISKTSDQTSVASPKTGKVVDITTKRKIRRNLLVILPSVAAILLIMCVALPAVLRVSKSESAMSEGAMPSATMEDAAPSADEAAAEASEAVAEAPAAESADAEVPAQAESAEQHKNAADGTQTLAPQNATYARGDNAEVEAEASEEAEAMPTWTITEAEYEDGMLIMRLDGVVPEDTVKAEYKLTKADAKDTDKPISEGVLSDLMERDDITDNFLILNLEEQKLKKGKYRLAIGEQSAEFEVK